MARESKLTRQGSETVLWDKNGTRLPHLLFALISRANIEGSHGT